jgi:aspartyl-tRNA(Asn)/glutamyl-tRNA(Gln) amidotransferase subunit B
VNYEVNWQIDELEDGRRISQATVLYNPDTGETRAMRSKEDSADYRYFPDPDLPPLVIGPAWVERVKGEMPELPAVMAARFESADGLPAYDATMMTQSLATARFYEATRDICKAPKSVANWLQGEVAKHLNATDASIETVPFAPVHLARLIQLIQDGTISNNGAKTLFKLFWAPKPPDGTGWIDESVDTLGLRQVSDTGAIEVILDEVLAANPKSVDEYRAGKDKAFNALVGQAMKATKGKANPALVNELLKKKLG